MSTKLMSLSLLASTLLAPLGAVAASTPTHPAAPVAFWARTYDAVSDYVDASLIAMPDGGFAVAGETYSVDTNYNVWLLRLDADGYVVWQKTYGGSGDEYGASLVAAPDGGFAVAGYTSSFGASVSDAWLLRLDAAGKIVWQKKYGGLSADYANSLVATPDGGLAVAGYTASFGVGGYDAWVLRLDATGKVLWQKTYGGGGHDYAWSLAATLDGGFVLAGTTESFGAGRGDAWVLRLDGAGDVLWQQTYGGSGDDGGYSLVATPDGGLVLAGDTSSFGAGSFDFWLLRLDPAGRIVWQKPYGGSGVQTAHSVAAAQDGSFTLAGHVTRGGTAVLKVASNGQISPGCELVGNSNAVVRSSSATAQPSTASVATTSATVASTSATGQPSTVPAVGWCAYRPRPAGAEGLTMP